VGSGEVLAQKRATSPGVSRRRNAQPWVNPALGARVAWSSIRSRAAGGTGCSVNLRTMRRRRTTSRNSMEPLWGEPALTGSGVGGLAGRMQTTGDGQGAHGSYRFDFTGTDGQDATTPMGER